MHASLSTAANQRRRVGVAIHIAMYMPYLKLKMEFQNPGRNIPEMQGIKCLNLSNFMLLSMFVSSCLLLQKLLPDESERVKVTTPRPLPKSRARVVISNKEVSSDIGVLTQTQAVELLTVRYVPAWMGTVVLPFLGI